LKLNYFVVQCNIPFKVHLPENGHNRYPQHLEGYAVYNTIHLQVLTCTCTCWP